MSSGLELLADEVDGRLHVAITRKGKLDNLYADPRDRAGCWASLYLARVARIDKRLDAAIMDLGGGLSGMLPAKHVHFPGADSSETRTGIADLLKPGQMLIVQVKSEGKKESGYAGPKLPRLTTRLYLFGQALVYSPVLSSVTISRKIEDENLLKVTNKLKGRGGWIVQPNARSASEGEILAEAQQLLDEWTAVQSARQAAGDRPGLLRAGPDAAARALCDNGAFCFDHIHAGNKKILDIVTAWSGKFHPALSTSKRLRLFRPVQAGERLFDMHDVFSGLAVLPDAQVPLNGGGSLIIEPTQAFTVIDVNQGAAGAVAAVNLEAAGEIARQMRLRNLSGAILIDFINMDARADRSRLVGALERACAEDYGAAQVHGFTRLGLIEVTRKRRTATLAEKLKS
jgi:ribonuclease G